MPLIISNVSLIEKTWGNHNSVLAKKATYVVGRSERKTWILFC